MIDKNWYMSSFLAFKSVVDRHSFHEIGTPIAEDKLIPCKTSDDIDNAISFLLKDYITDKTAILLSGGIDSAIIASYLPPGTRAYTTKCIGVNAVDETKRAKMYAEKYKLNHTIIEVTWDDYKQSLPILMEHDKVPIHSNEPQIYKLVSQAKKDGVNFFLLGDNADMAFGGLNLLLSKDWTFDEWVNRYTHIFPNLILKDPSDILCVYEQYRTGKNSINYTKFINEIFGLASSSPYINCFDIANIKYFDPYKYTIMSEPLDLTRIRSGESKYLLRELFLKKYPGFVVPDKLPMPRPMDNWLANWNGPTRYEFLPNCINQLTGEQKWYVYSLEQFLNYMNL